MLKRKSEADRRRPRNPPIDHPVPVRRRPMPRHPCIPRHPRRRRAPTGAEEIHTDRILRLRHVASMPKPFHEFHAGRTPLQRQLPSASSSPPSRNSNCAGIRQLQSRPAPIGSASGRRRAHVDLPASSRQARRGAHDHLDQPRPHISHQEPRDDAEARALPERRGQTGRYHAPVSASTTSDSQKKRCDRSDPATTADLSSRAEATANPTATTTPEHRFDVVAEPKRRDAARGIHIHHTRTASMIHDADLQQGPRSSGRTLRCNRGTPPGSSPEGA